MKTKIYFVLMFSCITISNGFSQLKNPFESQENNQKDNVYMTWNATTSEQEMNDDLKSLSEYGVLIGYYDVKRNSNSEIIAIKVTYADKNGSKGRIELDNQTPINTIKFFKQGKQVGFGEPSNAFNDVAMMQKLMADDKVIYGLDYKINPPNGGTNYKSRTMIKQDNKAPLVIEDGVVIEGGDDYSKEEIDEIVKESKSNIGGNNDFKSFNFKGNQDYSEQLQQIQKQLDELKESQEQAKQEKNNVEQSDKVPEKSKEPTDKPNLKIKKA